MTVHNTPQPGDQQRGKDCTSADHLEQPERYGSGDPSLGRRGPQRPDDAGTEGDEPSRAGFGDVSSEALLSPRATDPLAASLIEGEPDVARRHARETATLRALGQAASGLAHDLSQSLALIAGYGEMLERELAGPSPDARRLREYAATMRVAATDGGELARRMLTFSRVQAEGPAASIGAASLLRDVARLTAPRWREATRAAGYPVLLAVRVDGDDETLAILGWPSSLRDALMNLVLNAVDALPHGGEIRLSARRVDGCVELLVADTGVGMPPEVRARIFEPFFTTKGERGTELGLAQVFAVAQQHHGEIDVQSAPGEGTTFVLRLPAAASARDARPERRDADGSSLRVLAVDDDPAHGRMLAAMLGHDGHQVTVVTSAKTALERLAGSDFDVVVSDAALGAGTGGWDLAERARRQRPDLRVCLVTAWGEEVDRTEAAERGVDAVLAKPYGLGELLSVVRAR